MFSQPLLLVLLLIRSLHTAVGQDSFAARCQSFTPLLAVPGATLNVLEFVPANSSLVLENSPPSCTLATPPRISAPLCRIALNISTSPRSYIISEYFFPAIWSGRVMSTGDGGISGCINYPDMDYGASQGFVVAGSNNGHNGTGGAPFYNNPDVVEDYAWRALHIITETGKTLSKAFYNRPYTKSYYLGCSGGGRQGLHAGEVTPKDFDGILVGAPASNFNNMTSWRASFYSKTGAANSSSFINSTVWGGLIHDEVLRQCDGIDGVMDGIIEDPELCHFDPSTLLCTNNSTNCLSSTQVDVVKSIFSPLLGASNELVYPAMQPGSEIIASTGLYNGSPFPYSLDWFRYVVESNPAFTLSSTTFPTSLSTAAQALNPFNIQTFPSSLSSFASNNGKLLTYHGQQDFQISSFASTRLYKHLLTTHPHRELDDFYRLFRISGMGHCLGGPGAWMIGQSAAGLVGASAGLNGSKASLAQAAEVNVLAALVRWVEDGVAPETMTGTKFVDDVVEKGVLRRRRHCRVPFRNVFVGGDGAEVGSWRCLWDGEGYGGGFGGWDGNRCW